MMKQLHRVLMLSTLGLSFVLLFMVVVQFQPRTASAQSNIGESTPFPLGSLAYMSEFPIWRSTDISTLLSPQTAKMAWGDIDGDGDLDLIVAANDKVQERNSALRLYLNEAGGLAQTAAWVERAEYYRFYDIALGDPDGDGDLDLVVYGNLNKQTDVTPERAIKLFRNENGEFGAGEPLGALPAVGNTAALPAYQLAWVDADSDGDLDLGFGTSLYLNQAGTLAITPTTIITSQAFSNLIWTDLNRDQRPDLALQDFDLLNATEPISLYLNGGQLSFSFVAESEGFLSAEQLLALKSIEGEMGVVDLNHDGYPELLANGEIITGSESGIDLSTANYVPADIALSAVDYDNDGDLDVAIADPIYGVALYENLSTPFGPLQAEQIGSQPTDLARTWDAIDLDVDGDFDLDLIELNTYAAGTALLQYENRNGVLSTEPIVLWASESFHNVMSWGDIDRDGDLDVALGGPDFTILQNDVDANGPEGGLVSQGWSPSGITQIHDLQLADIDGDGNLDLFISAARGRSILTYYLNEGERISNEAATWAFDYSGVRPTASNHLALEDLNGDGLNEVAVTLRSIEHFGVLIFENGPTGLPESPSYLTSQFQLPTDILFGDIDGDGDLDLVTQADEAVYLFENEGGRISPEVAWRAGFLSTPEPILGLDWVDIDGDRDLDLIGEPIVNYINTGSDEAGEGLSFRPLESRLAAEISQLNTDVEYAINADFDGDGDLDNLVVQVDESAGRNKIFTLRENVRQAPERFALGQSAVRIYSDLITPSATISGVLEIPYSLLNGYDLPVGQVRGSYSIGDGQWLPAVPAGADRHAASPHAWRPGERPHCASIL